MAITHYCGRRIDLRPIEPDDEPLLRRWINDPNTWRTLNHRGPYNQDRQKQYIDDLYTTPDKLTLGIVVRRNERLIGCVGLRGISGINRSANFGLMIGEPSYQSRGYGGDATRLMVRYGFCELNLNRITLTVMADNPRAVQAYRRAGFHEEGRARQAIFRNGQYHDELYFGLLRSEWNPDQQERTHHEPKQNHQPPAPPPPASMTVWDTSVHA